MNIDGKELKITIGSFGEVCNLQKAVVDALKAGGLKIDLSGFNLNIEDIGNMQVGDIGGMVEAILSVLTDENLREKLFVLCRRTQFGQDKINVDFFENPENRKYYYPIMFEVLKVNLSSFFGVASFGFLNLSEIKSFFQKPK